MKTMLDIEEYRNQKQEEFSRILADLQGKNKTITITIYRTPLSSLTRSKITVSDNVTLSEYGPMMRHLRQELSAINCHGLYKLLSKERKERAA